MTRCGGILLIMMTARYFSALPFQAIKSR